MGYIPTGARRNTSLDFIRVIEPPPILVTEDDDDDFFFFRRAVRAAQIDNPLLRFRDGAEFVKFAEQLRPSALSQPPWLMFVDITMPIMNGFELLEWLRGQGGKFNLATIVLSGSRRDEDMRRALALGAKDYLVKPISPVLFAAIASEYLKPLAA
jgi:CheY-like chemotaxis protein